MARLSDARIAPPLSHRSGRYGGKAVRCGIVPISRHGIRAVTVYRMFSDTCILQGGKRKPPRTIRFFQTASAGAFHVRQQYRL
ncbi:hypothetical protein [Neisseria sp.]|uniref:hypothetical protein n=1 Tax=Neisseria sp. TaxID=192066 RepID=UPI00359FCCAD